MRRLALAVLLLAGLAGCLGSAPPVPRDHYYRVLVTPPPRGEAIVFPGVVSVAPLAADGLLRERPLLYSASGQAHEMQQHDYHYWMDPPPRMLQAQLVDYLRGSGLARSVITPELRVRPNYEVSGRLRRLERLLGGGPPRVAVEVELAMVESARNQLLVVDSYAAEATSADDSVEASVVALNQALARVFERFLADASWSRTAFRSAPLE